MYLTVFTRKPPMKHERICSMVLKRRYVKGQTVDGRGTIKDPFSKTAPLDEWTLMDMDKSPDDEPLRARTLSVTLGSRRM